MKTNNSPDNQIKILIIGGGPTGLFTSIALRDKFTKIGIYPEIHLVDHRLTNRSRTKQVVVLKKKYNIINKLYQYGNLIDYINKYKECTLSTNDVIENKEFLDGPYLCSKEKYEDDEGITILLSNVELLLMEYIKDFKICTLTEIKRGNHYVEKYISDFKPNIIIGSTGGSTYLRTNLLKKHKRVPDNTNKDLLPRHLVLEKEAGLKDDSYMLLYRFPLKIRPGYNIKDEVSFAWKQYKNTDKVESIYLTSQNKGNDYYDKQIYFSISKYFFRELQDCKFWRPCNGTDIINERLEIAYCADVNNTTEYEKLLKQFPNLVTKGERILSDDSTRLDKIVKTKFSSNIQPGLSFFIILVGNGSLDITTQYKIGEDITVKFIKWDKSNVATRLQEKFSGKITLSQFIGTTVTGGWNTGIWQVKIDNHQAMEHVKNNFSTYTSRTNDRMVIDTTSYLYKKKSTKLERQHYIYQSLVDFCKLNKNIIVPDFNEFLEKSDYIRIWTTVRWTDSFFEINQVNDIATVLIPLGDEAISVNPLTGSGISTGFKSAMNIASHLIDDTWRNKGFYEIIATSNFKKNVKKYTSSMIKLRENRRDAGQWTVKNFKRIE